MDEPKRKPKWRPRKGRANVQNITSCRGFQSPNKVPVEPLRGERKWWYHCWRRIHRGRLRFLMSSKFLHFVHDCGNVWVTEAAVVGLEWVALLVGRQFWWEKGGTFGWGDIAVGAYLGRGAHLWGRWCSSIDWKTLWPISSCWLLTDWLSDGLVCTWIAHFTVQCFSIVSCLASPTATSSSSLICNPNLSLSHHKWVFWYLN